MYTRTVMATDASTIKSGRAGILPPAGMDVIGTLATVEPAHGFSMASRAGSITQRAHFSRSS